MLEGNQAACGLIPPNSSIGAQYPGTEPGTLDPPNREQGPLATTTWPPRGLHDALSTSPPIQPDGVHRTPEWLGRADGVRLDYMYLRSFDPLRKLINGFRMELVVLDPSPGARIKLLPDPVRPVDANVLMQIRQSIAVREPRSMPAARSC